MNVTLLPDEFAGSPDVVAMLQAFYSRSLKPIDERLAELGTDMSKVRKALETYYIGYGHRSIGQCGTITLFIEDVSFIAAKAIQHHRLYNGQEASTRYIDFSARQSTDSDKSDPWFDLYDKVLPVFKQSAEIVLGVKPDSPKNKNAINAWAFDRARGWLPVNALTALSWHTTFDNLNVHLAQMWYSGIPEVEQVAREIHHVVRAKYPAAIPESYKQPNYNVFDAVSVENPLLMAISLDDVPDLSDLENRSFAEYTDSMALNQVICRFENHIDYGCWRELARHRSGHIGWAEPTDLFAEWYMSEFEECANIIQKDRGFVAHVYRETLEALGNILSLGCKTNVKMQASLPSFLYTFELRSMQTVHPILRQMAIYVGHSLDSLGIKHHIDMSETNSDKFMRRGDQTIVEKKND